MAFPSLGAEIKLPLRYGPQSFGYKAIFISWSQIRETNKPGYGQLCIFNSAEAKKKQFETPTNQGCTAEVMQRLDETL
jgi:hypothetical protein